MSAHDEIKKRLDDMEEILKEQVLSYEEMLPDAQ